MAIVMNNHVFKGHRTLLGNKYVTYGEVELPLRYKEYQKSKNGFDWGNGSASSEQLAFSVLCQLSNQEFAKEYAPLFMQDVIKTLPFRDWVLNASDVLEWIEKNKRQTDSKDQKQQHKTKQIKKTAKKATKTKEKDNVVKTICKNLGITQKQLAEILEVPEGTVSSWAVKNDIPRLGRKAIEFYTQNQKNQKIVQSYKTFLKLLNENDN